MHIKACLLSLILASPVALAARNPEDVKSFLVTPPADCVTGGTNVCQAATFEAAADVCPGGKTYCGGACGTWAGKSDMCCIGSGVFGGDYLEACKSYADALKSKGSAPLTEGCSDTTKYIYTGADPASCCSLDDDIILVYKDTVGGAVESVHCVKHGDGKSTDKGSGSNSTPTSANPSQPASASATGDSDTKKSSIGATITPGGAGLIASCFVAGIAGMVAFGRL